MRRSWPLLLFLLLSLLWLAGCGTVNSFANGCPGSYAGVRQDLSLLAAYGQPDEIAPEVALGLDGRLADVWDRVFVSLDVPLSALTDTLALPYTGSRELGQATPVALGCGSATGPPAPTSASVTRERSFRSDGTQVPHQGIVQTPSS